MHAIEYAATWFGIAACITQSALFAGLNLAVFSVSLLRLQVEADGGNKDALQVLDVRKSATRCSPPSSGAMSSTTCC